MKRGFLFFIYLSITLIILFLFATGSSLLTLSLNEAKTVPLGTFLTWFGIMALPRTIYWGSRSLRDPEDQWSRVLSKILNVLLCLTVLWLPIAYLLSGNMATNFTGNTETFQGGPTAMNIYWYLTYGLPIASILILLAYWIGMLVKKFR
ncbi:MAG: hypothetical protein CMB99_03530 [Flavobacteriaceae bacterium]|nr:hypothetical protein [Flavobacteriaceae bacterium]|tara:strand:+ start:150618 stop:151064 length:447 start_codon:yes stop_codon:yes gene_type:complete